MFTVLIRMKSVCLSEGKMTKICPICGNEFEPYHFNQKYCSEACSLKAKKLKERKWKKTHRKKMKESWDKYYAKNREKRKAYSRQWYLDNQDKVAQYKSQNSLKNKIRRCSRKHGYCYECPTEDGECLYD